MANKWFNTVDENYLLCLYQAVTFKVFVAATLVIIITYVYTIHISYENNNTAYVIYICITNI